jgi:hypothetical protein
MNLHHIHVVVAISVMVGTVSDVAIISIPMSDHGVQGGVGAIDPADHPALMYHLNQLNLLNSPIKK